MTSQRTPVRHRIGWIGTGVMGGAMCGHLLRAGHAVTVFNRTPARAAALLEHGATWAESPRAVAEGSDVIFTMVGFPRDVREVVLAASGALAGAAPGTVLVSTPHPVINGNSFQGAAYFFENTPDGE